jgi:hypothetical protein
VFWAEGQAELKLARKTVLADELTKLIAAQFKLSL